MRSVEDLLARLLDDPDRTAILCDFDGTLAPIQEDPATVEPVAGVPELLRDLSERFGVVAVVSGRPASYLAKVLGPDLRLSGLYGLESVEPGTGGRVESLPGVARWGAVIAAEADVLEAAAPVGVLVERKGSAVTVHHRTAPEHAAWVHDAVQASAERTGLEVHPAKQSFELRPPVPVDKGAVVAALAADCVAACYLGDDVGDLPAFAALDALARTGTAVVKVLVDSDEAAPELRSAADVVVPGPAGAVDLLRRLLRDSRTPDETLAGA